MANDPKAADTGDAPPPKSKKLLIIIIALLLVVLLAGGAVAALLLFKSGNADEHADDEEVVEAPAKAKKKDKKDPGHPPVFVNLEPFTVNLAPAPESNEQYLQVALSLEFEGPEGEAQLKANLPRIRNAIMLLLSSKHGAELLPREGKEKLAHELKNAINLVLEPPPPPKKGQAAKEQTIEGPVMDVLFTSFIIQ